MNGLDEKILYLSIACIVFFVSPFLIFEAGAANPTVHDPTLKLEKIVEGLTNPIDMTFIGPDDFLVAQKDNGLIIRVTNGSILPETLLDLNVANANERGLLGITSYKNGTKTYVFTYHTMSAGADGDDVNKLSRPLGSFVYRYELADNKLVNPKLLAYINTTSINASDDPYSDAHHVGGKITIGPDNNLYVIVGDGYDHVTRAQNSENGLPPDGTGGVIRLTQDGKLVEDSPFGESFPYSLYYSIGIRNGFGIDFDPTTGNLWDTEAGAFQYDEINLLLPGTNSGWKKVTGINTNLSLQFPGGGSYSDPELTWNNTVTPTDLEFLDSNVLGDEFQNDLFVGNYRLGHADQAVLYHFELTPDREELLLSPPLDDLTADSLEEDKQYVLVSGLGVITDLETGPDGYLYIVQLTKPGTIYRLTPS